APTRIAEMRRGTEIAEYDIEPAMFDLGIAKRQTLAVADAGRAVEVLRDALAGTPGPAQDVLALNAGASIYVGGEAASLAAGVAMAREILAAGRALETIEKLRRASHGES